MASLVETAPAADLQTGKRVALRIDLSQAFYRYRTSDKVKR